MSNYGYSSYGNSTPLFSTPGYGYTAPPLNSEPQDNTLANPLFYAWGAIHAWMVVLGYLTYTWYPSLLSSNNWLN